MLTLPAGFIGIATLGILIGLSCRLNAIALANVNHQSLALDVLNRKGDRLWIRRPAA
jgi:hypothetical protein